MRVVADRIIVWPTVAVAYALVIGCHGSSSSQLTTPTSDGVPASTVSASPTPSAKEDDLAHSMLLKLSDFPTGWTEDPPNANSGDNSAYADCEQRTNFRTHRTGEAQTGDFSRGGSASFFESVAVFETTTDAAAPLSSLEPTLQCMTQKVNAGVFDSAQAEFSGATSSVVSFPLLGDSSVDYRLEAHGLAKDKSAPDVRAEAYLDFVFTRRGRVAAVLVASDVGLPFDATELEKYARLAVDRLTEPGHQ